MPRIPCPVGASELALGRGNVVRDAGRHGIALQIHTDELSRHGTVKDSLTQSNVVIGWATTASTWAAPSTVSRIAASRNSALGIELVPGVIDGGGNPPSATAIPATA